MKAVFWTVIVVLILAGAAIFYALSPREIAAVQPPDRGSFTAAEIGRGEDLARLGYCNTCHTVEGGRPYAGGYAIETAFGTIYSTNITPDAETGIGRWSEAAFARAMRQGLDREGRHLYPAFPYNHFTKLSDADIRALYAFFMTRPPVRQEDRENDLPFPLNIRPILAGWKLLFFRPGRFEPDPKASEIVNHGAYLVEGLSHCGACHTPRNLLQAEKPGSFLRGGEAEGWYAPAIAGDTDAPKPWSAAALKTYLTGGFAKDHGVAAGPMQPVAENLARVPAADVQAIAAYLQPGMRQSEGDPKPAAKQGGGAASDLVKEGEALYGGLCAACHEAETPARYAQGMRLDDSTSLRTLDGRNFVNFLIEGVQPPEGAPGPFMPPLAGTLTDHQIVALAAFVRQRYAGLPAWQDLQGTIDAVRKTALRADAEPQR